MAIHMFARLHVLLLIKSAAATATATLRIKVRSNVISNKVCHDAAKHWAPQTRSLLQWQFTGLCGVLQSGSKSVSKAIHDREANIRIEERQ